MRILIADDHALFREGLAMQLRTFGDELEVLEAATFPEALEHANAGGPLDLILVDLDMPGMSWRDGLPALRERAPAARLVVLSASEDQRTVRSAMEAGASGFIPKTTSTKVMWGAVKLVLDGGTYLPPQVLTQTGHDARVPAGLHNLTPRQRDVLALIAKGHSNKEIARALDLTEGTVKLHVTALLKVLGASNRTQAAIEARRMGLSESAGAGS